MRESGVMTADKAEAEHRHHDPLAEVVVVGAVAWVFALIPLPIATIIERVFPGQGDSMAAVLTWGLVVVWAAFTLLVIATGQFRRH